eukprot:scaffold2804_cov371-Prasinococcus_capsulatus_cf.AAC.11
MASLRLFTVFVGEDTGALSDRRASSFPVRKGMAAWTSMHRMRTREHDVAIAAPATPRPPGIRVTPYTAP